MYHIHCSQTQNCSRKQTKPNRGSFRCTSGSRFYGLHDFMINHEDCKLKETVALLCEHEHDNSYTVLLDNNNSDVDVSPMGQRGLHEISYDPSIVLCADHYVRVDSKCLKIIKLNDYDYYEHSDVVCPDGEWFTPILPTQDIDHIYPLTVHDRNTVAVRLSKHSFIYRFLNDFVLIGDSIRVNTSKLCLARNQSATCNIRIVTKYYTLANIFLNRIAYRPTNTDFFTRFAMCEQIPKQLHYWSNLTYNTEFDTLFCSPPYLRCSDGTCLHDSLLCDGEKHCIEGEDENNCHNICTLITESDAPTPQYCLEQCHFADFCRCSHRYFQCLSGGCKPLSVVCDGVAQCEDSSDEPATCVYVTSSYIRDKSFPSRIQDYVYSQIQYHLKTKVKCMIEDVNSTSSAYHFPSFLNFYVMKAYVTYVRSHATRKQDLESLDGTQNFIQYKYHFPSIVYSLKDVMLISYSAGTSFI